MTKTKPNLQDVFLGHLCNNKITATIFLISGVKLQGIITGFDDGSIMLRRESHEQLIYKQSISTIMPNVPVALHRGEPVLEEAETNPV